MSSRTRPEVYSKEKGQLEGRNLASSYGEDF